MDKKKLRRAPLLIAATAAIPVLLGACGSSPGSNSGAPAAAGGATGTAQAGQVQFSQCMRQNGVTNFPDPQNGRFVMVGDVRSNPHYQTALSKCQHYLGPGGLGSHNPQNEQAQLAFAHCMQSHGVNVPDSSNGAIQVGGNGVNPNSPTFQNAFNACKSKLPGGGQGLRPGGGSGAQG